MGATFEQWVNIGTRAGLCLVACISAAMGFFGLAIAVLLITLYAWVLTGLISDGMQR